MESSIYAEGGGKGKGLIKEILCVRRPRAWLGDDADE